MCLIRDLLPRRFAKWVPSPMAMSIPFYIGAASVGANGAGAFMGGIGKTGRECRPAPLREGVARVGSGGGAGAAPATAACSHQPRLIRPPTGTITRAPAPRRPLTSGWALW